MEYEYSAGAVLFYEREGVRMYVLVHERAGYVGLPKGHIERGETERETALREIFEETGCRAEIIDGFREVIEYEMRTGIVKRVTYFAARCAEQPAGGIPGEVERVYDCEYAEALDRITFDNAKKVLVDADTFLAARGK